MIGMLKYRSDEEANNAIGKCKLPSEEKWEDKEMIEHRVYKRNADK